MAFSPEAFWEKPVGMHGISVDIPEALLVRWAVGT